MAGVDTASADPNFLPSILFGLFRGGLRTADVSPSLASHSPNPFEKLVFLGAVFPKYGPYMGSVQGAEHFLS